MQLDQFPKDAHSAALRYISEGSHPLPVPHQSKKCVLSGWATLLVDGENVASHFPPDSLTNIALRLDSGQVDIDLDSPEARSLAADFLPPTARISGRIGNPHSHYWYSCDLTHETFAVPGVDNKSNMLVEIRSGTHLTVVPPSIHVSGEEIVWHQFGAPSRVEPKQLRTAVVHLAIAAYLCQSAPGEGARQEYWLAAAGHLLRCNLGLEEVERIVRAAATEAGDDEVQKRVAAVKDTAEKQTAGTDTTGGPRLAELSGEPQLPAQIAKWLGIASAQQPKPVGGTMTAHLVELGRRAKLVHDEDRTPYAVIASSAGSTAMKLTGSDFKHWLTAEYLANAGSGPGRQPLSDAINTLSAIAVTEGDEVQLHVRVAQADETLYLDLARKDGAIVKVTPGAWEIVHSAPVYFRRPRGMRPLPLPVRGGDASALDALLNIGEGGQRRLLWAWLTFSLREAGPFPVMGFVGEQGSAKSSATRIARRLVDPHKAELRPRIRDERDLVIAANNSWMLCFDNLSTLPAWASDAICRLATGGGFGARQLYTDDEETLFDVKRPVILNGIDDLAERGDLIDRIVLITLPVIPERERRAETEIWSNFQRVAPEILGALLDGVAGALAHLPSVRLTAMPRMADYARWGVALERALGWPEGSFVEAYRENRRYALATALDADVVSVAIHNLMQDEMEWRGTAVQLLQDLTRRASTLQVDQHERYWPKSPNQLSRRLRRVAPVLREYGIEFHREREGADSRRIIVITKSTPVTPAVGEVALRPVLPPNLKSPADTGLGEYRL